MMPRGDLACRGLYLPRGDLAGYLMMSQPHPYPTVWALASMPSHISQPPAHKQVETSSRRAAASPRKPSNPENDPPTSRWLGRPIASHPHRPTHMFSPWFLASSSAGSCPLMHFAA